VLTLGDVADRYLRDHVNRETGAPLMVSYVAALRRVQVPGPTGTSVTLEHTPMDAITTADVEHVRSTWRRRAAAAKGGRVGADRALKRLRHLFNWAIEKGYVEHTPFRRHGVTVVHFRRDEARTRRLEPGEEARLIEHASPFMQALIVAALETGCRRGELLGLRWRDVKAEVGVLLLPGAITRTGEPRDVPMTQRLKAVLELRRHAPDGTEHGPEAYVFGNEVGEAVQSIRDAWAETCRQGRDHRPALSRPASRVRLAVARNTRRLRSPRSRLGRTRPRDHKSVPIDDTRRPAAGETRIRAPLGPFCTRFAHGSRFRGSGDGFRGSLERG
jgi:integrase